LKRPQSRVVQEEQLVDLFSRRASLSSSEQGRGAVVVVVVVAATI